MTIGADFIKYTLPEAVYTELVTCQMEIRPLKLNPGAFKKVKRVVISSFINNNLEFPFSLNLFGTPDSPLWYLLNASNTFTSRRQLVIGKSTFRYMQYILIIGGKVDKEAYFTGVVADYEDTFGTKLR